MRRAEAKNCSPALANKKDSGENPTIALEYGTCGQIQSSNLYRLRS
ncbi:MAG: hypothetical protein ACLTZB_08325 [Streptococcus salivarius]